VRAYFVRGTEKFFSLGGFVVGERVAFVEDVVGIEVGKLLMQEGEFR
jgi:hypothetical protein